MVCSRVIETEPMYKTDQPRFLNQIVRAQASLDPIELWHRTWEIQKTLGRQVTLERNLPRTIDIDLLDVEGVILRTNHLHLPHPKIHERLFLLHLLQEIDPLWKCSVSQDTLDTMIQRLERGSHAH